MPKKSQDKGRRGEQELAALLRDHLGAVVQRTGHQQGAEGGFDLELHDCSIEVKRYRRVTDHLLHVWWNEVLNQHAIADIAGDNGKLGVLAYRADQQEWRFMVPQLTRNMPGLVTWDQRFDMTQTYWLAGFCDWYRGLRLNLEVVA